MDNLKFYIVDVFAEELYSGNQLAVFVGADGLSTDRMQRIALEMNYSESTFVSSKAGDGGAYDVRIFTPKAEVPFAGHPVLGTAYVIDHFVKDGSGGGIKLNLKVGRIPVRADDSGVLWMDTPRAEFGPVFDKTGIAEVLGIDAAEIDQRYPVQSVSTGIPFIIVPLKTLATVKKAKVNTEKLLTLADDDSKPKEIFVFCPETYESENDINSRMFAECYGIIEDPATGSANSCLAAYLVKHAYYGKKEIDVRVEQGYEIGRQSLLYLRAVESNGEIDIRVGGRVIPVAKGKLLQGVEDESKQRA